MTRSPSLAHVRAPPLTPAGEAVLDATAAEAAAAEELPAGPRWWPALAVTTEPVRYSLTPQADAALEAEPG